MEVLVLTISMGFTPMARDVHYLIGNCLDSRSTGVSFINIMDHRTDLVVC